MWTVIAALQLTDPNALSLIYAGDVVASKGKLIAKVRTNFIYYQCLIASIYQGNMFVRHSILSFLIHGILLKTLLSHVLPSLPKASGPTLYLA